MISNPSVVRWRSGMSRPQFYEYFQGDNGAGLGASHQTGWTGLIVRLLDLFGRLEAKDLELEREQVAARLVREQVGGEKMGGQ